MTLNADSTRWQA